MSGITPYFHKENNAVLNYSSHDGIAQFTERLAEHLDCIEGTSVADLKLMETSILCDMSSKNYLEIEKLNEVSQNLSQSPNNSKEYSQCLRTLEQTIEVMKNIKLVLEERRAGESLETHLNLLNDQLQKADSYLRKRYSLTPLGPSQLLQKDITNIKMMNTIPKNETYETPLGKFCEPKISMMKLIDVFSQLIRNDVYTGVSVSFKVDKLYSTPLNTMATLVCFKKDVTKSEPIQSNSLLLDTKIKKDTMWLLDTFKNVIPHSTEKQIIPKKMEMIAQEQKQTLAAANQTLLTQLENWNYSAYEIVTEKELIENYNAPIEFSGEGDFIILFHKKNEF
jgi:hypothetical protein